MRRSVIFDVVLAVTFHTALVLAAFLLLSGHNQPGGGFVGGLVAGAALGLRYLAGGTPEVRRVLPLPPWTLLGLGLVAATVTALVPLIGGSEALDHTSADWDLGPFGVAHVSTALIFDIGVALVVVGMVQVLLLSLGREDGPPAEVST